MEAGAVNWTVPFDGLLHQFCERDGSTRIRHNKRNYPITNDGVIVIGKPSKTSVSHDHDRLINLPQFSNSKIGHEATVEQGPHLPSTTQKKKKKNYETLGSKVPASNHERAWFIPR